MSLLPDIASGFRSLFRKELVDRELDEELRRFLDMAAGPDQCINFRGGATLLAFGVVVIHRPAQLVPSTDSLVGAVNKRVKGADFVLMFKDNPRIVFRCGVARRLS